LTFIAQNRQQWDGYDCFSLHNLSILGVIPDKKTSKSESMVSLDLYFYWEFKMEHEMQKLAKSFKLRMTGRLNICDSVRTYCITYTFDFCIFVISSRPLCRRRSPKDPRTSVWEAV